MRGCNAWSGHKLTGGLQFRYVYSICVSRVACTRFLLGIRAGTLEKLRVYSTGQAGKGFITLKNPCSSELVTHRKSRNFAAKLQSVK